MAARLSHFFTARAPDLVLHQAAADGLQLLSPEGVKAQALRLLASPESRRARVRQHVEWLGLDRLDPEALGEALASDMLSQSSAFLDDVLSNRGGWLGELLTSAQQPLNRSLAEHYGIDVSVGDGFELVELDPALHAGVLAQGAWLARNPRPTLRARAIFDDLLCNPLPTPPAEVTLDGYVGNTPRERITNATAAAPCRNCHGVFDPAGFALEAFDDQGRLTDLDTTGALTLPNRITIELSGPGDLGFALAGSEEAQLCAARRYVEQLLEHRVDDPLLPDFLACLVQYAPGRDLDLNALAARVALSSVMQRMTRPASGVVAASSDSDPLVHAFVETEVLQLAFPDDTYDSLGNYKRALGELQVLLRDQAMAAEE